MKAKKSQMMSSVAHLSCNDPVDNKSTRMFACSEQSCTKTFVRYSALVKHCDLGAHTRALERITVYDRAKLSYAQHLQEGQVREWPSIAVTSSNTINCESHVLPMGWALKQSSNKARFSEKQKQFLDERFNIGERTGKKSNGEDVAQQMRRVCRPDGNRLFYVNEFFNTTTNIFLLLTDGSQKKENRRI